MSHPTVGTCETTGSVRRAFVRLTDESRNPVVRDRHVAHVAADGHWTASVSYLDGPEGSVWLEWCDACPHLVVACEHLKCSWDPTGTVLICGLCGEDVA